MEKFSLKDEPIYTSGLQSMFLGLNVFRSLGFLSKTFFWVARRPRKLGTVNTDCGLSGVTLWTAFLQTSEVLSRNINFDFFEKRSKIMVIKAITQF